MKPGATPHSAGPARSPALSPRAVPGPLERADLVSLRSLRTAYRRVLDALVLLKAAVTVSRDRGVVNEDVRRGVVGGDETIALVRVEPLHCSLSHCALLFET